MGPSPYKNKIKTINIIWTKKVCFVYEGNIIYTKTYGEMWKLGKLEMHSLYIAVQKYSWLCFIYLLMPGVEGTLLS